MTTVSKQYSSFWLDEDLFDDENDEVTEGTDLQRISRLAAVRRAVANFVSILTNKNMRVVYSSGKGSMTDGETVVISAEDDPSKFDVMVGLALHEGSHVLLSKFDILKSLEQLRISLENKVIPHAWETPSQVVGIRDDQDNLLDLILHPYIVKKLGTAPAPREMWSTDYSGKKVRNRGNYGNPPEYYESEYWATASKVLGHIKFIMNILEDRRVDQYVYRNCGGYRPYYDALYARYFFTTEVGRNLRFNPEWRTLTVDNYISRLLYAYHPDASLDAMPGLRNLMRIMDIQNIDRIAPENDPFHIGPFNGNGDPVAIPDWWDSIPSMEKMPIIWQVANNLYAEILRYCDLAEQQKVEMMNGEKGAKSDQPAMRGDGEAGEQEDGEGEADPSQLPNYDGSPQYSDDDMSERPVEKDVKGKGKKQKQVDGKFNQKKADKDRKEAEKLMNGELKKKQVKKDENTAIDALEKAEAEMVDIKGEGIPFGRTMVTRRMSESLMEQDWFIFKRWGWKEGRCTPEAEASITAGRRMGAILHHRLQVRNDPIVTKQTRLLQGGLDRRLLAQLGMEITSVFQKSRTDTHKPVMLHLTLDASGSMGGKKWNRVRTVAVALAYLGSKLKNVDTVISIRGGNEMPMVAVIFDSRRDHFNRFIRYIKVIEPNGATPEGLCYKATMDLILETKDTHDVYFINFSDGQPSFGIYNPKAPKGKGRRRRHYYGGGVDNYFAYDGEAAWKHTRQMVQMLKDNGVKILSYFITEAAASAYSWANPAADKEAFRKMYGEDAEYVNVENAAEVLRTLNKLLLARG